MMAWLRWKKTWILAVSWNRCSLLHQSCLRRNASPMQARLRKCNQRAVLYRTYKSRQKDLALEERMEKVGFKTERYLAKECASCCDSSSRLLWARGNTLTIAVDKIVDWGSGEQHSTCGSGPRDRQHKIRLPILTKTLSCKIWSQH